MKRRNPWDEPADAERMRNGMKLAAAKRTARMSETVLQKQLVKLLNAYARLDIEWHHVPNGHERHPAVARELKEMGTQAGVADLMFLIDGRSHALELKTEIGTQSGTQDEWQQRYERAGGAYHMARGIDEAIGVLTALNVFRPGIKISTALGKGARSGELAGKAAPRTNQSLREAEAPV